MPEAKTKPTRVAVATYFAAITDAERRADCDSLITLMHKVTGEPPVMWGASIVGFGAYDYTYASGHQGTSCLTGFSSRKGDISIYLVAGGPNQAARLAKLGKHKMGKACLYVRRLADVDLTVLEEIVRESVDEVQRRHG
jgi:hypothetical protein